MTQTELNEALESLGWSGAELGRRLGRGPQAVSEWRTGKVPVPTYVAEYLRAMLLAQEMLKGA